MEYFSRHPNDTLKIFELHDYHHRKGCFKKTTDCRFHYPRTIQESHELKIDFKAEPSIVYVTLYNTKGNQEEEQFPFLKHCTAIAKHLRKLRNQERERERDFKRF
jgi:hypothetical protein